MGHYPISMSKWNSTIRGGSTDRGYQEELVTETFGLDREPDFALLKIFAYHDKVPEYFTGTRA